MKFKKIRAVEKLSSLEYYDTNENCPCNYSAQCACETGSGNTGGGNPGCVEFPEM